MSKACRIFLKSEVLLVFPRAFINELILKRLDADRPRLKLYGGNIPEV